MMKEREREEKKRVGEIEIEREREEIILRFLIFLLFFSGASYWYWHEA